MMQQQRPEGAAGGASAPGGRSAGVGELRHETFTEAGPLGMTFSSAEATSSDQGDVFTYLAHVQPHSQAAGRSLSVGMRLVRVGDWDVRGAPYSEVVEHMACRPVTLTLAECEVGRTLHSAPSPVSARDSGWQELVTQSAAVIQALKEEVATTNMVLLHHNGRHEVLEPDYVQSLEEHRRTLGDEHPETLASIASLAALRYSKGDLAGAAPLFVELLAAQRRGVGNRHPKTIDTMLSLAAIRKDEGDLAAAEPLYAEALARRRSLNGDDDPQTITAMLALGVLRKAKGSPEDLEQAEVLLTEAEQRSRSVLGAGHPDSTFAMQSLGSVLQQQAGTTKEGKAVPDQERSRLLARAEPLLRASLAAWEQVHGPDDPETISRCNNLANLLKDLGDLNEAEGLLREALKACRENPLLGDKHPQTLASINNLAHLLELKGDLEAADLLYSEALQVQREVLGPDHPDTLLSINNMAVLCYRKHDFHTAKTLMRDAASRRKRVLGPDHADTKSSRQSLEIIRQALANQPTRTAQATAESSSLRGGESSEGITNGRESYEAQQVVVRPNIVATTQPAVAEGVPPGAGTHVDTLTI